MPQIDPSLSTVLVTGATGKQGGAVARSLLERGIPVRALVRHPDSDSSRALQGLGAVLQAGDLNDTESLSAATEGVRAVFSVQLPDPTVERSERVQAGNLVAAARRAGVSQFVQSSLSGVGSYHRAAPGWAEHRWDEDYWESKADVEELVEGAGFEHWTILQPGFFMENFVRPSIMFVDWTESELLTVLHAETMVPLTAVRDIGVAAALVIAEPGRFDGMHIPLASDYVSMSDVATTLSEAWGEQIPSPSMSIDDMLARPLPGVPDKVMADLANLQEWMNVAGHPARPEHSERLGLPTTSLAAWARELRAQS
ncbi:MAG: NmrA/HSCARG family protein [Actinomycetota bacterium]